ncbi:esterase/lipase family protein [Methanoregula sp. UBA64]|jgi:triacylglycerol lipase|uniref:esterase/lipase family protein n=1 Tax=Methanoregula sp. UBA64 TaxID=1915554 RepID=UPI0025FC2152|nr:acetyltransferase [Methanoregula sp. UBA64]
MSPEAIPAILVHGWKSHPGIWNRLVPRLQDEGIPFWSFDYTPLNGASMEVIAAALGDYISAQRREKGYDGPIDIVCHSIGSCVTRYLLEVMDGSARRERVRRLIAIGPPNNGSALAELFCDPVIGPGITRRLAGTFVPEHFDPAADVIVQACRPKSRTMQALRNAGMRPDIGYHLICAENSARDPAFFPALEGKTCELLPDGSWQMTYAGDGIVPLSDSALPGASLLVLPSDPAAAAAGARQYCHILLPRAPETIAGVIGYLAAR